MLEQRYYNVTYNGFNITKGMQIPLIRGRRYNVRLRYANIPSKTNRQLINVETVVFVHDKETDRCIACIPYKKYEWNIERDEVFITV